MQHFNKRGFILLDSLVTVLITCAICLLCFSIFNVIETYNAGTKNYRLQSNEEIEDIYNNIPNCEACILDEFN